MAEAFRRKETCAFPIHPNFFAFGERTFIVVAVMDDECGMINLLDPERGIIRDGIHPDEFGDFFVEARPRATPKLHPSGIAVK